jgi:hypothetical protein
VTCYLDTCIVWCDVLISGYNHNSTTTLTIPAYQRSRWDLGDPSSVFHNCMLCLTVHSKHNGMDSINITGSNLKHSKMGWVNSTHGMELHIICWSEH